MRLILLGAPGSGKGTIASDLKEIHKIPHISTGDIFRKNIKEKTELGIEAEKYIIKGKLVPDDITIGMVEDRLNESDCSDGFLLDGFPRTIPQADSLAKILKKAGLSITAVINVIVSDDLVLKRLTSRRVCKGCGFSYNIITMPPAKEGVCDKCGSEVIQRSDDQEETIKQRLITYHKQTSPLVDYYKERKLILDINNEGSPQEAIEQIEQFFSKG